MTRHGRWRAMLARRAELTPIEERRLRDHLENCPECRESAAAYEHQWHLLRSLPPLATPPTLRGSVLNRIHAAPLASVPWYRRRLSLMAPVAAAMLALVTVAWVAGFGGGGRHPHGSALQSHGATPTAAAGIKSTSARVTPRPHTATRPGHPPRQSTTQPTRRHSGASAAHPARTSRKSAPPAQPQPAPTVFSGAPQPTFTPVPIASGPALAAGAPPVTRAPRPTRHLGPTPSLKQAPARSRHSGAASQPRATVAPAAGPVNVAAGPPPTSVPQPSRLAPIRGTPPPATAVPAAPPVIVATPGVENTPMPIIPPTPTPGPAMAAGTRPATATPTPTPTPTPTAQP